MEKALIDAWNILLSIWASVNRHDPWNGPNRLRSCPSLGFENRFKAQDSECTGQQIRIIAASSCSASKLGGPRDGKLIQIASPYVRSIGLGKTKVMRTASRPHACSRGEDFRLLTEWACCISLQIDGSE